MPMIVLSLPERSIPPERTGALARKLVSIFVEHHVGFPLAERLSEFTHVKIVEHSRGVSGDPTGSIPRYDVEIVVPEGTLNEGTKEAMATAMGVAILAAEGEDVPFDPDRVWCLFRVIPEGRWLVGGAVVTRKSILRRLLAGRKRPVRVAAE